MTDSAPVTYEKGKLYELNIADMQPDPEQPRKYFDEQALSELKASIKKHGVLQPVLVRKGNEGTFIIVSGERRYQAAKNAGLETIPAILTDSEPAEISIIENLLRENLTAIEEAEAVERLRALHEYGLADLSTALGKSDSAISEILSLNRLPTEVKDDCRNAPRVSRKVLEVITRQKTPEKMHALYSMKFTSNVVPILRDEEIEAIANRLLSKVDPECINTPAQTPIPSILQYLKDNHGLTLSISDNLGYINERKVRGKQFSLIPSPKRTIILTSKCDS